MKLIVFVARVLLGGLFIGHGTQKLLGWFGGPGPDGTGGFFEALGLRPGRQHAIAAGTAEAGGGALLALGLATPAAAAAITGVMTTAIRTVHQPNGPWVSENGWEYPAVIIATVLAITEVGPGPLSLDAALGRERSGVGWALAALAAGVGGSTVLLRDWERPAPAAEEEPAAEAPDEPAPAPEEAQARA
jgi:putative oxidoreductase